MHMGGSQWELCSIWPGLVKAEAPGCPATPCERWEGLRTRASCFHSLPGLPVPEWPSPLLEIISCQGLWGSRRGRGFLAPNVRAVPPTWPPGVRITLSNTPEVLPRCLGNLKKRTCSVSKSNLPPCIIENKQNCFWVLALLLTICGTRGKSLTFANLSYLVCKMGTAVSAPQCCCEG